jgi:FlaA1/EpsC-like NDP-sugar epimerase
VKVKPDQIKYIILDIILIVISIALAFILRFESFDNRQLLNYYPIIRHHIIQIIALKLFIYYFMNIYRSIWEYASIPEMVQIVATSIIANLAMIAYFVIMQVTLPRSIYLLVLLLDTALMGLSRFAPRAKSIFQAFLKTQGNYKRIMIIGAGQAGALVIKEFNQHDDLKSKPAVLIDDDPSKQGKNIAGVRVAGTSKDIEKVAKQYDIDEIIIAIPTITKKQLQQVYKECQKTDCKVKKVPGIYELINGKVDIKEIKEVEIEDLLGRDEVHLDVNAIFSYVNNKTVMVTGGGGSIGSELCRQIAEYQPKRLIILDFSENSMYDILNELRRNHPILDIIPLIASVRDNKRIVSIFSEYRPEVVFHAAAHKHVPLMEYNPHEAIKNNVFGTLNVVKAADMYNTNRFILISTDKAVNPTNIMGATKRIAEMIIQSYDKNSNTEYAAVRFGNVLGSNGSVVPLFKKQIEQGGPITVTHPEITRYFMTIPEAVQLVIQAGSMAKGGEIFVLDMGEPVKIVDLAENLIKLSGFEPYQDIDIMFIGLRPGEKLYEELLMDEEGLEKTENNTIYVGHPLDLDFKELCGQLEELSTYIEGDVRSLIEEVKRIVPTYKNGN